MHETVDAQTCVFLAGDSEPVMTTLSPIEVMSRLADAYLADGLTFAKLPGAFSEGEEPRFAFVRPTAIAAVIPLPTEAE